MTKLRKSLAGLLATAVLSTGVLTMLGTGMASAMTPAQPTSTATVNNLYRDVDAFWRTNFNNWGVSSYYRTPSVNYYNVSGYHCGYLLTAENSFACSGLYLGQIWFGTGWTQKLQNSYGDYASGVVLAHEWGHEIMYELGWTSTSGRNSELFADCLAGMYTHYGLLVSQKLDNSDYWEGYNTLWAIADPPQGSAVPHGTPQQRTAWYQYGYTQYNINSCALALSVT